MGSFTDILENSLDRAPVSYFVMFAPVFHSTKFPVEILEQIFLHLSGQDVIRMEVVRGVISSSFDAVLTLLI